MKDSCNGAAPLVRGAGMRVVHASVLLYAASTGRPQVPRDLRPETEVGIAAAETQLLVMEFTS